MIAICILTKNCGKTLGSTLESVSSFPEVIILDNGSTDETLEVAASFHNVKIHRTPFLGFGRLRNLAAKLASFDWILALDSDETLSFALVQEIRSLALANPCEVYSLPRHNYYNGKRIRGCGWDPQRVFRLYHRRQTSFKEMQVHESLQTEGCKKVFLNAPIHHIPYRNIDEFLSKMQHYSTLFADQHKGQKSSSLIKAVAHGVFAFFSSYLLKRGFLDGKEGLIISLYNGNTALYKYLKLAEFSRSK